MKKRIYRHRDHGKRHNTPSPNNQVIAAHLEQLLTPAIFNQQAYYRQLGLRDRILNLSLMVAAVLTLIWRQVPSPAGIFSSFRKRRFTLVSGYESSSTILIRKIIIISSPAV
jgi:hypothetical protein